MDEDNTHDDETHPSCRLLVRSKKSLEIFTCPNQQAQTSIAGGITILHGVSTSFQCLSPDGSNVFVQVVGLGIMKLSLNEERIAKHEDESSFFASTASVQMMCLSPGGKFALTWERWYEDKCPRNLKVWNSHSGSLVAAFTHKAISREAWPLIQWTGDEKYGFLLCNNNQIRVYEFFSSDLCGDGIEPNYLHYLPLKGCTSFAVPQTKKETSSYFFTSFSPVQKDKAAAVTVHQYTPTAGLSSSLCFIVVACKSMFQAESCSAIWSPTSDAVIVTLQTSIDATGKSYYGSSRIFLWNSSNVINPNEFISVDIPQENGPVLSVSWVPKVPANFIVVAGQSPAMSSLHHGVTGKPIFQFGNNVHRNTVDIAPHGRFFALGGFGNLAGSLSFWDVNKRKLLPHDQKNANMVLRAEAVTTHEWSPSSRLFVVATCSPRMNVDNGIRLYKYTGEELTNVPWDNLSYNPDLLLQVAFIPTASSVFPDRPQSPPPELTPDIVSVASKPQSLAGVSTGKYVPPSARRLQTGGGLSLADRLRKEKQGSVMTAGKVISTQKGTVSTLTGRPIPGLAVPTTTEKNRHAIKREKQKVKKQQEAIESASTSVSIKTTALEPEHISTLEPSTAEDYEKRSRKLKKSLKQIEDLKQKDPKTLNEDQQQKLMSEFAILKELEQLKGC